jgi:myo-inositol catabolism protein IolS
MKFTSLGTTGLKVSQLGFGTYVFDNNIWRHDISDEEAIELMTYANSQGVNYFNSSLYYGSGKCEELLGKAIKEMKREDVVVCTKVGSHKDIRPLDNSPEFILKSTENILKRMDLDYIDVFLIHGPDPKTPLKESIGVLNMLKETNIVKHIGLSNHSLEQIKEAQQYGNIEVLEFYYSLLTQNGIARGNDELRNYCLDNNIAMTTFRSIERGILSDLFPDDETILHMNELYESPYQNPVNRTKLAELIKKLKHLAKSNDMTLAQLAIAWSLQEGQTDISLIGMSDKLQIDENVKATELVLNERLVTELNELVSNYSFDRDGVMNTTRKV